MGALIAGANTEENFRTTNCGSNSAEGDIVLSG
jgi:hypothetical protein